MQIKNGVPFAVQRMIRRFSLDALRVSPHCESFANAAIFLNPAPFSMSERATPMPSAMLAALPPR